VGVFGCKGPNGQARERLVLLSRQVKDLAGAGDAGVKGKSTAMQRPPLRIRTSLPAMPLWLDMYETYVHVSRWSYTVRTA
jgi:hypothetical protein